jgi:DNA adenine methylase
MIRSPLRYPGGKSRVVEKIVALLPPFSEFREPFVGGGSVFIHLRQKFPDRKFWINDKYTELIAFWRELQSNSDNLIAQIWAWKRDFNDGKQLRRFLQANIENFSSLETAAAFFVFNRITFSGTTEAGGFSEQAFRLRFTDSSIERLTKMPEVLRDVKITNLDYEELINVPGEDVFLFLDPPYFSATSSALYGKNGKLHKNFDHERFAANLKKCPHRWLLTYDDSPFVRELFSFANIVSWNLMYGMRNVTENSKQLGSELLITNFDFESNAPLFSIHDLRFTIHE